MTSQTDAPAGPCTCESCGAADLPGGAVQNGKLGYAIG